MLLLLFYSVMDCTGTASYHNNGCLFPLLPLSHQRQFRLVATDCLSSLNTSIRASHHNTCNIRVMILCIIVIFKCRAYFVHLYHHVWYWKVCHVYCHLIVIKCAHQSSHVSCFNMGLQANSFSALLFWVTFGVYVCLVQEGELLLPFLCCNNTLDTLTEHSTSHSTYFIVYQ